MDAAWMTTAARAGGRGVREDERDVIQGFLEGRAESHGRIDAWIGEVLRSRWLSLGADREDVAQEVRRRLLAAFRAAGFRGESSLRTYVWRATQHAALNQLRTRRRRPADQLDAIDERPGPGPDPLDGVEREERRKLCRRLLDALGEDCRRLITMTVFDELPYRVIAERLGLSEGSIKVRALRCRRKALELYRRGLAAGGR